MSNALGRMPFTAEVHALERKVGGDEHFVSGGNSQRGGIVADSGDDTRARAAPSRRFRVAANSSDELEFFEWQSVNNIPCWSISRRKRDIWIIDS